MKTSRKIVAMLMIALVAVFAFAGCSSSSGKAQNTASSAKQETKSESKSEKSTSSKETASALMIGKITNINGKELTLDLYKSDKDVTEVKDIDAAALTDTGEGETVALQDDVVVESQSNGVTQTAAADNLAVDSQHGARPRPGDLSLNALERLHVACIVAQQLIHGVS